MRRWLSAHPLLGLALGTVALLLPFAGKPFNMDDPLFIWAARHIRTHPENPYNFGVNWFGVVTPMWEATKNPPLASYYLALAGSLLGWSEWSLHGAMILAAVAVIIGTYRLAGQLCQRPLLAAIMTLVSPAFLISSTTVMCDVLMLALWVWAVSLWIEGTRTDSLKPLLIGAVLVALATMTKYYGAVLIPLLAAFSLISKRRLGWWSFCLLIPVTALIAYAFATHALYGKALLLDAVTYAKIPQNLSDFVTSKATGCLVALTFTGGCFAGGTFSAPAAFRPRVLIAISGCVVVIGAAFLLGGIILKDYGPIQGSSRELIGAQALFWGAGGALILALAVMDVWRNRNPDSWLLGLWVIGTFLFAGVINWTVNGRSLLPMAPAVSILIIRRLDEKVGCAIANRAVFICMTIGAVFAMLAASGDFIFAKAVRESAHVTFLKYGHGPGHFFFQGHWGFQYYMAEFGVSALDLERTELKKGDVIAIPENNTNLLPISPELAELKEVITVPGPPFVTTTRGEVGAGFYTSRRGPLPFAFGIISPERVTLIELKPPERAPNR